MGSSHRQVVERAYSAGASASDFGNETWPWFRPSGSRPLLQFENFPNSFRRFHQRPWPPLTAGLWLHGWQVRNPLLRTYRKAPEPFPDYPCGSHRDNQQFHDNRRLFHLQLTSLGGRGFTRTRTTSAGTHWCGSPALHVPTTGKRGVPRIRALTVSPRRSSSTDQ